LNDGVANFAFAWELGAVSTSARFVFGDFDGDLDADAVVIKNPVDEPNYLWINQGDGTFVDSGRELGTYRSWRAAVADFNLDSAPDVFIANTESASQVWFNEPTVAQPVALPSGGGTFEILVDGLDLVVRRQERRSQDW
jgi:hypothetical protein